MKSRLRSCDDVLSYSIANNDQFSNSIPSEKQKRRARILKLRYETHATIIQSRWRGAVTRTTGRKINPEFCNGNVKTLEKCMSDMNFDRPIVTDEKCQQHSSELNDFIQPKFNNTGKEQISTSKNQEHEQPFNSDMIPFKEIKSIIFSVEGATGLPVCCTSTRVSVRLVSGNRETISTVDTPSLASAECIYSSPKYSLQAKWEVQGLPVDATVLCRVDTLERPTLAARCLGYAVVKLFVDKTKAQPTLTEDTANIYLNTGEFYLPILHGRIPDGPVFREDILNENMLHIAGAHLKVRVFDSSKQQLDADSRRTFKSARSKNSSVSALSKSMSLDVDEVDSSDSSHDNNNSDSMNNTTTIAVSILECHLANKDIGTHSPVLLLEPTEALQVLEKHQIQSPPEEFEQRQQEKGEVLEVITRWMEASFQRLESVRGLVNPAQMLPYSDSAGSLLGLDMLYNMPDRRNLIRAADEAAMVLAIRQGLSSGWDNKLKYFKTVFRYLPGKDTQSDSNNLVNPTRPPSAASTDFIIDDASVKPALSSHELSPMYLDELSCCTAGLQLSTEACLLVQVTAVDVLTSAKALSLKETSRNLVRAVHLPLSQPSPNNSYNNSFTGDGEELLNHISNDVPTNNNMRSNSINSSKHGSNNSKTERMSKLRGLIGIYIAHGDSENTWWGLLPLHSKPYPLPSQEEEIPRRGASPAITTPVVFSNAGSHSIPLFQGLPPDELITSDSPWSWLLATLREQRRLKQERKRSGGWLGKLFKAAWPSPARPASDVASSSECTSRPNSGDYSLPYSDSNMSERPPLPKLIISRGASAVVRVVDARLKRAAGPALIADSSATPSQRAMLQILRAYCARVDTVNDPSTTSSVPPGHDFPHHHPLIRTSSSMSVSAFNSHPPSTLTVSNNINTLSSSGVDERKFQRVVARFAFNALKHADQRTLQAAIPPTIDPHTLIQEINLKFTQTLE